MQKGQDATADSAVRPGRPVNVDLQEDVDRLGRLAIGWLSASASSERPANSADVAVVEPIKTGLSANGTQRPNEQMSDGLKLVNSAAF